MSPAGHWPQLHAAIEAGADSVYFGLSHFTARAKAGFTLSELPDAVRTLHRRGVRGFVTFNTLVFDHELAEAARTLAKIAEAGADAIIVQDIGALRLAQEIAPDLELHASTQMSITDAAGARLAVEMGVHRVTLARELSLTEIRAIRRSCDVELECFVHGALCVAYSGQCFSSEAWGGRSANRGQCAQACRLPYDMIVDGERRELGDARYLLSPGDLYALHQVPELIEMGVSALKIEGRYKDAEYVAAATLAYRKAVDAAWENRPLPVSKRDELDLEQIYSRGLGPFFMAGTDHQAVVRGRAPRHRGVLVGEVVEVSAEAITIEPSPAHRLSPLKPGDGVVFDASDWRSPQEAEEGGRVFKVSQTAGRTRRLRLEFGTRAIDTDRIRPGDLVWRTDDPALAKALRPFTQATSPLRTQSVDVAIEARVGEPLRSTWVLTARPSVCVVVTSEEPLAESRNRAVDEALLRQQFERLGGTPYALGRLTLAGDGRAFAPASVLNQVRRDAVTQLAALQEAVPAIAVDDPMRALARVAIAKSEQRSRDQRPSLHLLLRTPDQLDAAIVAQPASITLDYLDLYGLKPSLDRVRAAGLPVRVATPRVLKPGEEKIADFLLRLDVPLLVRPAGLLETLRGRTKVPLTGDFSLNAANAIAAVGLLDLGLTRITPTHDLNADQVARLAEAVGGERIEAIVYQHLPVFHTEHCVFCRFLSTGTSFKDCGRPCEEHRLELADTNGRKHPVLADIGCRNTVFGAEAQEASEHLDRWLAAGIRDFRIEFAHESANEVTSVTQAFQAALDGRLSARVLGERLRHFAPQGATPGSLFVPSGYAALPILQ